MLTPGMTHTATLTVTRAQLAVTMGSGDLDVLATPAMVALMEQAAMLAVRDALPEGSTTVGARIDTAHLRPTPEGATVTATATLTAVEGRKLTFSVTAADAQGPIGEGTHVRYIVDARRFMAKVTGE